MAQLGLHHGLVVGDDPLPAGGVDIGVDADAQTILVIVENVLEAVVADAQHDVRVHGDEAAVAVEREALVAGQQGQAFNGGIVEAEIENRVHHARHRGAGAGAHGDQQRVFGVAEALARDLFQVFQAGFDLVDQAVGQLRIVLKIVDAGFGGDGETGRDRQVQGRHFGEIRPLAAQQRLHRCVAIGLSGSEGIDPMLRHELSLFIVKLNFRKHIESIELYDYYRLNLTRVYSDPLYPPTARTRLPGDSDDGPSRPRPRH